MAHYGDDRSSRLQVFFPVLESLDPFFFLDFFNLGYCYAYAQLIGQYHYGVFVYILVDVGHYAQPHQGHDDLRGGYSCLFAEACYCDWSGYGYSTRRQCFHYIFFLNCLRLLFVVFLWP